ncbi:unnamed protein product [Rhizophagus irregularis]|nr:unnamed protein product [Rhizophagus irregularis]
MKETKNTLNHLEFLKVKNNPPCKLNMNIDNLLRDRYNNNSYNLYQRNVLARLNKKGCGSKSKKMWKEESEEIKKFFKILAIEGNRRFKLRNPKSPSTQPPPQPPKKKLPLLLPRPPLTQPYVYYQPHSYEYYQPQPPQPLSSPVEYWKMHKLSDESRYQPQQLPIHCVSAVTPPLFQPQLQPQLHPQLHPQLSTIPPQPLPQQYVNYQQLLHEDNQSLDDSWLPDEFHLPISQPLPELLLNNEHEQPQSPLAFDVYFNDLD